MTLPRSANVVVIGGGVVGCSIAYHLALRGLRDVLVLEREAVGSGTTSKAAGGIRAQFPTETEIRFSLEAIAVFERFAEEFGVDPGYRKIGYLFLVADAGDLRGFEERMTLQRRTSEPNAMDLPVSELSGGRYRRVCCTAEPIRAHTTVWWRSMQMRTTSSGSRFHQFSAERISTSQCRA